MADITPLLRGTDEPAYAGPHDDSEADDVPDAAPVVLDEVGETWSFRDFCRFVGEPTAFTDSFCMTCSLLVAASPFCAHVCNKCGCLSVMGASRKGVVFICWALHARNHRSLPVGGPRAKLSHSCIRVGARTQGPAS